MINGAAIDNRDGVGRVVWNGGIILHAERPTAMPARGAGNGAGIDDESGSAIATAINRFAGVRTGRESGVEFAEIVPLLFSVIGPPSAQRKMP